MSISIVTVTYNSSKKIIQFLNSVKNQIESSDIELIIIDNNSPDQTQLKNKINSFKKNNEKLKIITVYRKTNLGFGASCNYGVTRSNNDCLLFLNPDTKLGQNSLSILYNHAIKFNAEISGGKSLHSNSNEIHRTVFNRPTFATMLLEFSNLGKILKKSGNFYIDQNSVKKDIDVSGVGGAYLLIRKDIFKKLGGFNEKIFMYLEDVDICIRAKNLGLKIMYCPHSVIKHVGGASSNNKHKIVHNAWYDSREYYAKKHFSFFTSLGIIAIYKIERRLLSIREKIKNL